METTTKPAVIFKRDQISPTDGFFETLATTNHLQLAVMNLGVDEVSGDCGTDHPHGDQRLLVLEGTGELRCEGETVALNRGDVALIPAGALHQVIGPNRTLSVYGPIAYPEDA